MSEHTSTTTEQPTAETAEDPQATTIAWLEEEFPGWSIGVDEAATVEGELQPLWIARREGHHPQSELSPAKLHSRLSDYLDRERRRQALAN